MNNPMAKAFVTQDVLDKHSDQIKDATSAKDSLDALQKVYVRGSSFYKLKSRRKLVSLKCTMRDTVP